MDVCYGNRNRDNDMQNDLISRQDAIDAIRGADGVVHYWSKQNAIKVLEDLPSAQPERCDDCENFSKTRLLIPQPDITEEDVKEYCRKRCLKIITSDLYHEMQERWSSAQPEIIRCKDCKHYYDKTCGKPDWYNANDDFCSRAERREDDEVGS